MFTGLVAEMGTVERLREGTDLCKLSLRARQVLEGLQIGDSVAVNGVCLTVTERKSNGFTADVMPETVRRTTLHELRPGDRVNLERALRPSDRLDGHIVQGHVEGVGTIVRIRPEGNALVYGIDAPAALLPYIVPKGSIAVDGISLTVTEVGPSSFGVSLIPHTAAQTTLGLKKPGDRVNLETDILARYIERFLAQRFGAAAGPDGTGTAGTGAAQAGDAGGLTLDLLRQNGF
ncbi:MAG: Riboflavin synthase [Succiniclasticum sp.]|jgi:riboflavin synthase